MAGPVIKAHGGKVLVRGPDAQWYDFAEWLYEDTQKTILRDLEYLIERGVDPAFAIKTLRADSDDMWYPRRKEMVAAGIITEDQNFFLSCET